MLKSYLKQSMGVEELHTSIYPIKDNLMSRVGAPITSILKNCSLFIRSFKIIKLVAFITYYAVFSDSMEPTSSKN
jgi:hypothetical protein